MKAMKIVGFFGIFALLALAGYFSSAAELMKVTYTLNPQTASTASDHTLSFKTPSALSSGTITLYLRNVVDSMGSTTVTFADIDFSHGSSLTNQTQYTLAAAAGDATWGVAVSAVAKTITFTYPTSNGTQIAAQEYVIMKIGKNADGGTLNAGASNRQVVNSASTSSRTFTVVLQPTGGVGAHVGTGYARGGAISGTLEAASPPASQTTSGGTPSTGGSGGSTSSSTTSSTSSTTSSTTTSSTTSSTTGSTTSTGTTGTGTTSTSGTTSETQTSQPAQTVQPAPTQQPAQQPPPPPPELAASASGKVTDLSVAFTCSASGGTSPYTYSWTFGDGTTGTGASVAHAYKSAGNYSASCTVKDATSKTSSAVSAVQVSEALSASVTDATIELKSALTCSASGGTSPYAYAWTFGDGTTGTGASAEHIYKTAGLYTAACTVTDALGKTAKASRTIAVVEPLSLNAGMKLGADASLVQSVDGFAQGDRGFEVQAICMAKGGVGPYVYVWSFGDGSSSTLGSVTHVYRDVGTKSASCTVSDARGKSITGGALSITVRPGLRVKTAASPAGTATTIVAKAPASLQCTASGGLPGYAYKWNIIDESGKAVRNDSDFSSIAALTFAFERSENYSVRCTVKDKNAIEVSDAVSVGVAPVELAKALDKPPEEIKKEIDAALNDSTEKIIADIKEIAAKELSPAPVFAPETKTQQQPAQVPSVQAPQVAQPLPSSVSTVPSAPSLPPPPPSPAILASTAGVDTASFTAPPPPPPGSSEAVPNVAQNTVNMTITTSNPVTGALCEQVGIKNADNTTEMFVWFCPRQAQPTSLLTRIKLAAQNAWYGLKRLALGSESAPALPRTAVAQQRTASQKPEAISLDINQSLSSELSSSVEKQLLQESKKLIATKIKHANDQQLEKLPQAVKMVLQSGLQTIDAYSLRGERLGDASKMDNFKSAIVVKKSLAGRIIEVIVPGSVKTDAAADIVVQHDTFFTNDIHDRSVAQVSGIQKEFNKLAQQAYDEGLKALRKRYEKEIALSADVDEALRKTVLQRLQDSKVQKQLIDLARSTVVQRVVTNVAASAAKSEEPIVPGQQPTLSQLLHTPDSVTIAPLNQGQAEKLLQRPLILSDFPGAKPIPNQIKEVSVLDANGMGLVRLPSPMKLTMCWDEALLKALNISIDPTDPSKSMCIAHFNPSTGGGKCEDAVFDPISKCATASVDSVSIFALFGKTAPRTEETEDRKPRVQVNIVPSVRLRFVESLIESDDLGIYQDEEATVTPSELGGNIYIAPSTQLSLCISPNAFLKKVKDISVSIGSKTKILQYEQSRECFSGALTVPSEKGAKKVQMRIVYIDDQVQTITLNTVVTNRLQAIVLNQLALPVGEVAKIVAAVNEQVKETVEATQPALQTTAIATAPVVAVANPAVLTNTVNWYHYFNHLFSWIFSLLGFRKKRKPWGVVYDAAAKHPIDLAVVRLFDAKTKKLVETQVTDKQGRFSFLTAAGTYSISVAKPPLTFPSAIVKGRADGDYGNIYRQEEITVASQDQVMSMSIPLDPPSQERAEGLSLFRQLNHFFKQHSSGSLIVGLVISGALAIYTPGLINQILLGLNGIYVVFQFTIMGRTEKPWGIVFSTMTLEPVPLAAISIIDAKENKVLRTRLTDYYGRFNFLTPPGEYSVIVSKDQFQFPIPESQTVKKFRNVYRGGTVRIKKDKGYIKINVPLAPKSGSTSTTQVASTPSPRPS